MENHSSAAGPDSGEKNGGRERRQKDGMRMEKKVEEQRNGQAFNNKKERKAARDHLLRSHDTKQKQVTQQKQKD